MTSTVVIVGIVCLIIGWFAHYAWDVLANWWFDATDVAGSIMRDLLALVGIIALVAAGAYWAFG